MNCDWRRWVSVIDLNPPEEETDHLNIGHTQELKRHFGILSLIGLASTTTISWTGLGLGLVSEINAGGPGAGKFESLSSYKNRSSL
jgi:hypothetical protein